VKVKKGQIYISSSAFNELTKEKLPGKTSYDIIKLTREINNEIDVIEKVRLGLVEKYGEKTGNAIEVKRDSQNHVEFVKEMNEVLDQEIDLNFDKVKIKVSDVSITPNNLAVLEPFMEWI